MKPLDGVRILDLSRLIPGPFTTMILSDLGAQVDKVEDAGAGDYLRHMVPQRAGASLAFHALNRGKRSAVVNLKNEQGREAFVRLLANYDVLFEQFRPGVLDRLGLSHASLLERYPKLVICALTGYGQTGPLASRAGHDLNYLARAGLLSGHGPADGPPQVPGFQMADVSGGMWCAIAILAALRQRDATGKGQICDIAMTDGVLGFAALHTTAALAGEPIRRGDEVLTGGVAPYNAYLSKDGVPITIGSLEPKFWMAFCAGVGIEPDPTALLPGEHQRALKTQLAEIFATKTAAEWSAFAEQHDCCVESIVESSELADDPHLNARGMFFDQQVAGESLKLFRTPVSPRDEIPSPAPAKGADSRTIFAEAGFSDDEIQALVDAKAIAES
jgi:alpha-methylacyl-CoA racemase